MKKILILSCLSIAVFSLTSCDFLNAVDTEQLTTIDTLREDVKKLSAHPYKKGIVNGKENGTAFEQEEYIYTDGAWSEVDAEKKLYKNSIKYDLTYFENSIDSLASSDQKVYNIYKYSISGRYKIVYSMGKSNEYVKELTWTREFDKYGCVVSMYQKYVPTSDSSSVIDLTIQYE